MVCQPIGHEFEPWSGHFTFFQSDYFRDMQQFMLDWCSEWPLVGTGDFCLMRISLVRISLLRFFKTFHKYLPYANFGLLILLLQFFGQKTAQNLLKANRSN